MVRDARTLLNMKRNKRNQGQQQPQQKHWAGPRNQRFGNNTNQPIQDARQVLHQKKFQGIQKAKFVRPNFRPNFNKNALFTRKQGNNRNFVSKFPNSRNFPRNNRPQKTPNKNVQVARNGVLKVTRTQNQNFPVPRRVGGNRFIPNMSGITVVARNKQSQIQYIDDPMDNGDELESMTLQDIPEIDAMRDLPHSFLTQKSSYQSPVSSHSTLLSRLAKTVNETMVADSINSPNVPSQQGWKVVVSNLYPSVTQEDMLELFGHVGRLKSADLIQPGTALIEYYTKEDALHAYELYNDRLLDGYPMQCSVPIDPMSSRTPIASRLGGKYTAGPSSFYQRSAASSSSSSAASRRVKFTVKLP